MFKSLFEIAKQIFGFASATEKNKEDIKTLLADSDSKDDIIKQIIFELRRLSENEAHERENEAHEREKMALRMQLALKDTEQRLAPSSASQVQSAEIAELRARVVALGNEVAEHKKQIAALENDV